MLCSDSSQQEFVVDDASTPTYYDLDSPPTTSEPTTNSNPESNVASLNEPLNVTKAQLIRSFIEDLEFDYPRVASTSESSSITTVDESDADEEEEDEVTEIKFPYERENMFEDLIERIAARLNAGELDHPEECDAKFDEVDEELRREADQAKLEKLARKNQFGYKNDRIFTCLYCSKSFSSVGLLEDHIKIHNSLDSRFRCPKCKSSFKYKKNLLTHMKNHTAKPEFECKECCFVFRTSLSLEAHMQRVHRLNQDGKDMKESEMVKCKICAESIPEVTFKRHLYYCENKEIIAKKRAEQKSRSVPPSPAFSVASCKSIVSMGDAPVTSPTVSIVDKSCPVCKLTFASRQSLLRHISRKHKEHANDENVTAVRYVSVDSPTHQYACGDCGKRLTTRAALTLHRERIHNKTVRHECEVCHKSYPIPSELRKHIKRVHNKEVPEVINEDSLVEMVF